jgi:hypothetical protein
MYKGIFHDWAVIWQVHFYYDRDRVIYYCINVQY